MIFTHYNQVDLLHANQLQQYSLPWNFTLAALIFFCFSLIVIAMTPSNHTIPDRSPPGSTRTAPSAGHQDGGVKCATGASSKIRGRDNITIGTWNTRTLRAAGKLQELTHEMDRYRWNILGLCEMRWKNFGETTTEEGHKVFFSGKEDKHEHGVGFLVHKDIVNTVMGCRPSPSPSTLGQSLSTSQ